MKRGRPKKQECNYDCFNCIFADCINNHRPTQKEREMLKKAMKDEGKG